MPPITERLKRFATAVFAVYAIVGPIIIVVFMIGASVALMSICRSINEMREQRREDQLFNERNSPEGIERRRRANREANPANPEPVRLEFYPRSPQNNSSPASVDDVESQRLSAVGIGHLPVTAN